jgi:hypothetical protein
MHFKNTSLMMFMARVPAYFASRTERINSLLGQNAVASNVKACDQQ